MRERARMMRIRREPPLPPIVADTLRVYADFARMQLRLRHGFFFTAAAAAIIAVYILFICASSPFRCHAAD